MQGPGTGVDYENQISQVNALFNQKEQELRQVSMQRQAQLEKLLKKSHSELQDKMQRNQVLEREVNMLKVENSDQKSILSQYEERFV